MKFTAASLARYAAITGEILAHCAGLRAVGRERLAVTIESGDYTVKPSYSREVVFGLYRLRAVLGNSSDANFGVVTSGIESAFEMMLCCTRDGIVADGTSNAAYSAARLETSEQWVAVEDVIQSIRDVDTVTLR